MQLNNVFLGIPFNDLEATQFRALLDELKILKPAVRFQQASTPHITLLFFGDLRLEKVELIKARTTELAAAIKPFEVNVDGIHYFGSAKYPRVIWQAAHANQLNELGAILLASMGNLRNKKDDHDLVPHVTLARVESRSKYDQVKQDFERICSKTSITFSAKNLRLYYSDASKGIRQGTLADFAFGL